MKRVKCRECGWKGSHSKALTAPSPFYKDDILHGCPNCQEVNTLYLVCDEPKCWTETACGTPTKDGYRQTCGKHKPED